MKVFKNTVSLILSMILMFSLMVAIFAGFVKGTVFNENSYLKIMERENIYGQVTDSIYDNVEYAMVVNNMPAEYAEGIIDSTEVRVELATILKSIITYVVKGENNIAPVDMAKYEERLHSNIQRFIRDSGLYLDESITKTIEKLEQDISQLIRNELEVVNLSFISESQAVSKVIKIVTLFNTKVFVILLVIPIVLIAIIALIWGRKYKDSMRWISYGFLTSGITFFAVFITGYFSEFYYNIIIGTPYLKSFVANLIKDMLLTASMFGLGMLIIGIILLIPKLRQYYRRSLYKIRTT